MRIHSLVITLGLLGLAAVANAQPSGERPPGPPPEAIEACKGKVAGDTVTLTMPDGKQLQGVCTLMGQQLVARPPHQPGGHPPPRPQS